MPQTTVAHQVQIANDIGATIHIEPNDTPRAGEDSLTWFALTQRGGTSIPLSACDCQLAVYAEPYQETASPILTPELSPISAEGYENIPSAEILFPEVGAYRLVLSGEPAGEVDFQPFSMDFEITVAVATTPAESPSDPMAIANTDTDASATEHSSENSASADTERANLADPTEADDIYGTGMADSRSDATLAQQSGFNPWVVAIPGAIALGGIGWIFSRGDRV